MVLSKNDKLAEVRTLVVEFNVAIVCVTETWLDDLVMDSEIDDPWFFVLMVNSDHE